MRLVLTTVLRELLIVPHTVEDNALHPLTSPVKSTLPLVLIAAVQSLSAVHGRAEDRIITRAIEVRSLAVAEANRGIEANLRGVVVFVEGPSAVFVQDESSTTFFSTTSVPLPTVGDEIEVRGATRMGLYLPGLGLSTFRILGHRALPPGIPARYEDLVFGRYHYQRVALEGIVRSLTPVDSQKS